MIFSVPNIQNILKNGMNNGINFEHTFLVSKNNIEYMLIDSGFKILEIKDYSPFNLFVCCEKSNIKDIPIVHHEYKENKNIFLTLLKSNIEAIKNINNNMSDDNFFIFGAHINSQYLFHLGLKEEQFKAILDNDPAKIGKRLYGTDLSVESPDILKKYNSSTVILKNGIYNKEIHKQILTINNSTKVFTWIKAPFVSLVNQEM